MRRLSSGWQRFWFEPQPTSSLALLRIAIGAIALAWALSLVPDFGTFFSSHGVEPVPPTHQPPGIWGVLDSFPAYGVALALFGALIAGAISLMVGYRTRLASVVVFVAVMAFENRAPSIWNSGDSLLRIVCFFLMFAPAGESLSVDRWRRAKDHFWEFPARPPWALRLIQIQVSVVYLSAVWFKLHGPDWLHGTAVSYSMRLQDFQRFVLPGALSHSVLVSTVATYLTIATELMVGILVWNRAARPLVLMLGVILHVSIGLNLALGFFSEVMLACYLAFLSPQWASRRLLALHDRAGVVRARIASGGRQSLPAPSDHSVVSTSGPNCSLCTYPAAPQVRASAGRSSAS
jgi:uncharacterized membrane protein YphA (DoxX/SURF4 family)